MVLVVLVVVVVAVVVVVVMVALAVAAAVIITNYGPQCRYCHSLVISIFNANFPLRSGTKTARFLADLQTMVKDYSFSPGCCALCTRPFRHAAPGCVVTAVSDLVELKIIPKVNNAV
ncbi:hypothetical protein ElyMa_003667100 [Elysia marginata]|uniref:Secreted protein n=1 Tax=Elysia marginata TaxID=1093978 RepID=A0AAV4EYF0_9GAST|nr:hypothetical protein ElyMa_003667100 [Elysia marginata]